MALTVTPVKGNPILATWGAEIRDRSNQVFASYAELTAQWPNAPEGAQAVTLDDGVMRIFRGGLWQRPLDLPWGIQYRKTLNDPVTITGSGVPGTADWAEWTDPQRQLTARRTYMLQFSARVEATVGPFPITYGGVVNVDTQLSPPDYPLSYHGGMSGFLVGQEVLVYGWPLERVGSAYRASTVGFFTTGGNPGQALSVAYQHVIIASPNGCKVLTSQRFIAITDIGPA